MTTLFFNVSAFDLYRPKTCLMLGPIFMFLVSKKILHQSKLLLDISENFLNFRAIEKIGIYHIFELLRLSQFSATFNIKEGLKRVKYLF